MKSDIVQLDSSRYLVTHACTGVKAVGVADVRLSRIARKRVVEKPFRKRVLKTANAVMIVAPSYRTYKAQLLEDTEPPATLP